MLYYGCKDLGLHCWKLNKVVVAVIFLKHNGLCVRLADSNYFYTEESIPCTCTLHKGLVTYELWFKRIIQKCTLSHVHS